MIKPGLSNSHIKRWTKSYWMSVISY